MNGKRSALIFFLGPALALILVFYIVPLVLTVYVSFTNLSNWNLMSMKVLDDPLYNYERLLHMFQYDPDFRKVVYTTIVFTLVTLVLNVGGGLLLALIAYLMEERLSTTFRALWLLPRMTPVAVYALLWYYFFSGSAFGTLNAFLRAMGLVEEPIGWGTSLDMLPWGAWLIIIYVNMLVGVSFGMIVFYSALRNIPWEHVVAARVDGASTLQLLRYILIPSIRWHLVFVTVWQLLSLLTTYAHIFLLVEWGAVDRWWASTWSLYVFMQAFYSGPGVRTEQGLAAAAASILVIIGAGLGLLSLRLLGFRKMMQPPRGEV
ncbi:binding-protein-dependent transport systems inner membrane component [Pyrolobus fumarii 1A]|uniref:Binding-protein-dependent transport systems inner membrane component n=1 Tax=Pyrolobus fumarii (strain DSM 11204 / 1A) TaxID=694429 RepID=G0EE57_PYRF1|nr:sugar ABC transporter permease [Pyrolobus fumarii]AEM38751.1 binding-protein-dependent transport systems inner membrane component [Pyrolobus fumarii 1A]